MVKVICNQALDEMLLWSSVSFNSFSAGANSHKVFRSLGCLVSHANKMGKTAEQVHNLDLNLQLVSPLVNRYFIYAYRTFMRGSLQLKRQRINY